MHAGKALDGIFGNPAFGTTCEAHVDPSGTDGVEGDPDGVGAGGTGGCDGVGKSRDAEGNGDVRARFVCDKFGHGERRNPALAAFDILVVRLVENVHAGKAVSGHDPGGVFGKLFAGEVRVLDRFVCGGH